MDRKELKKLSMAEIEARIKKLDEDLTKQNDPAKLQDITNELQKLYAEKQIRPLEEEFARLNERRKALVEKKDKTAEEKSEFKQIGTRMKKLQARIHRAEERLGANKKDDKSKPNSGNQKKNKDQKPQDEKKDKKPENKNQPSNEEEIVKLQANIERLENEKNLLYSQFYTNDSKEIKEIERKLGNLYSKMAKLNTESKSDKNDNKEKSKEKPKERLTLEQWKLKTELEEKIAIENQKMTELYYQGYNDGSKEIEDIQSKIKELYAKMPKPKADREDNKEKSEMKYTAEQLKLKFELEEKIAIVKQEMAELYYQGYNDSSEEIKYLLKKEKELYAKMPRDKEPEPKKTPEQIRIQAEIDKLEEEKALLYSQFYTDGSQEIKDIQAKIDKLHMEMENPTPKVEETPIKNPIPESNPNKNSTSTPNPNSGLKPDPIPVSTSESKDLEPHHVKTSETAPIEQDAHTSYYIPVPIEPKEGRLKKMGKGLFGAIGRKLAQIWKAIKNGPIGKPFKWVANRYLNKAGNFKKLPWEDRILRRFGLDNLENDIEEEIIDEATTNVPAQNEGTDNSKNEEQKNNATKTKQRSVDNLDREGIHKTVSSLIDALNSVQSSESEYEEETAAEEAVVSGSVQTMENGGDPGKTSNTRREEGIDGVKFTSEVISEENEDNKSDLEKTKKKVKKGMESETITFGGYKFSGMDKITISKFMNGKKFIKPQLVITTEGEELWINPGSKELETVKRSAFDETLRDEEAAKKVIEMAEEYHDDEVKRGEPIITVNQNHSANRGEGR